jgi:VWFA-related protein
MRCALIVAFALPLAAQESRFDVRSRLVLVPVTVTDANGRSVDDLEPSDFVVLDNERARKVTVDTVATGVAPIALVIAVQSSGISGAVLEKVRRIGAMIQPLITGERGCAGVVSFDQGLRWLEDCTNDSDALERALSRLRPGEHKEARMLDAVNSAIERLGKRPNSRRVLLLISESRDRGSETDLDVVTVAAQSADVTIYAATYSALKSAFTSKSPVSEPGRIQKPKTPSEVMGTINGAPPSKYNGKTIPEEQRVDLRAGIGEVARLHKTNTTEVLAGVTGGTTFPFTRQKGLEDAIEKLGAELHTQYMLSFAPEDSTPGYHKLEVRVVRAGQFSIRARPGYWSTAATR